MIVIDIIAAHMLGDFVLQTSAQARLKFTSAQARAMHVSTYCLPFAIVAMLHAVNMAHAALFLALLWASHYVIDARRWGDAAAPLWLQIVRDQTLHVVALVLIVRVL